MPGGSSSGAVAGPGPSTVAARQQGQRRRRRAATITQDIQHLASLVEVLSTHAALAQECLQDILIRAQDQINEDSDSDADA